MNKKKILLKITSEFGFSRFSYIATGFRGLSFWWKRAKMWSRL